MTMFVSEKINEPGRYEVGITYGPISIKVEEDTSGLFAFWSRLNEVLPPSVRKVPTT